MVSLKRLIRNRLALSTVIAALILVLLIGSLTTMLVYLSSTQMRSAQTDVEVVGELSNRLRENLEATLTNSSSGTFTIRVNNTGSVPLAVSHVLLVNEDGSLTPLSLSEPVRLVPLESKEFSISVSGSFRRLGLQTERGNVFAVVNASNQSEGLLSTYNVDFYIYDEAGNAVDGATVTFNGLSYSHGQSTNVPKGSYSLSTGTISSGYQFSRWETSGGVKGAVTASASTTVTISSSGSITMRLTTVPFDFSVSVYPSSGSVSPGESATTTVTVRLTSGSPAAVTLSASGLPKGASASFSPSYGTPTFRSTMRITTSPSTPTGTYTVTVTGTSGKLTRTAKYTLTVSTSPPETATVTFSASGLGSDTSEAPLTVDGAAYFYSQLPVSFTWDVGSSHSFQWNDFISSTTSGKRYTWVSASGLSAARGGSITVPSGGGSISAVYQAQYRLTISVTPSGAGSTTPPPGSYWYDSGSSETVVESPNTGYSLSYWTLDDVFVSSKSSYTVTMNAPHALTAVFSGTAYTISFYIYDGAGNAVTGAVIVFNGISCEHDSSTNVAPGSYSLSVGTIPSGYQFSQWETGGGVSPASATSTSTTVTVSGSGSITMRLTQALFDFSVSLSPSSGSATPGGSATATVTVSLVSGSPTTVSLSASGLPSGATATFNPSSGTPGFTSTLTITTSSTTPTGTYTITITGTGGSLSRSTTYALTVTVATYAVTFTESGLPSGTSWSVTFGSQTQSSTGSTITFNNIPAGTYSWSASSPISGGSGVRYVASPASGFINVPSQTSQSITYSAQYQWTFSASGLDSDASGTVVTVDGTNYAYSSLPVSFWWDIGSPHSYAYQQYVSSTTSGKRYANHNPPSWSGTISSSESLNPSYHTEYQLTIGVSPSGGGSTNPAPGTYWHDSGARVQVTATPGTGYSLSYWSLDGSNVGSSSSYTVTMNAPHALTAVFSGTAYTISFYIYDGAGNAVTGATLNFAGSSYSNGQWANIAPGSYSLSTGAVPSGYTFNRWETSGSVSVASSTSSSTTATVSGSGSITMRLTASSAQTATVTFSANGLSSDASGTVLTVDGTGYTYIQLPKSFTWDVGSSHSFQWNDPVSAGSGKQYAWVSTSGLSTSKSGSITVPSGGGSITAAYKAQYYFTASSAYGSPTPTSGWFDSGTGITASVTSPVSGGTGIRYVCTGWTGTGSVPPSGSDTNVYFVINAPSSVTWNWKTQYQWTFSASGLDSDATWLLLTVDSVDYGCSNIPLTFWWDIGSSHSYAYQQYVSSTTSGKRYANHNPPSATVSVSGPGNISPYYHVEYKLTVKVNPSGGGSVSASPSSADWFYDSGTSVMLTASASSGYAFDAWTGDASGTSTSTSISVNAPKSVTANFFTFTISISPSSGSTPQGGSASATVTISYGGGVNSKSISLSASGLPSDASSSFNPSSVTISPSSTAATSTMTVSTSTSTSAGSFTITVTGAGGGLSKTATYLLTITVPVTFNAYDSENQYVTSWTNYYSAGYNTITVPSSTYAFGYDVGFWKWSDGTTSTSKYVYLSQPTSYTVYYKTPISKIIKNSLGYAFPTNVVSGVVKSVHGDNYVYGTGGVPYVQVSIEWHLSNGRVETHTVTTVPTGGTPPPGVGYVVAGMFGDTCGYSWEYVSYVKIDLVGVPDGYQDCAGVVTWYP